MHLQLHMAQLVLEKSWLQKPYMGSRRKGKKKWVPKDLMEAEIFGFEKGAFTG